MCPFKKLSFERETLMKLDDEQARRAAGGNNTPVSIYNYVCQKPKATIVFCQIVAITEACQTGQPQPW